MNDWTKVIRSKFFVTSVFVTYQQCVLCVFYLISTISGVLVTDVQFIWKSTGSTEEKANTLKEGIFAGMCYYYCKVWWGVD